MTLPSFRHWEVSADRTPTAVDKVTVPTVSANKTDDLMFEDLAAFHHDCSSVSRANLDRCLDAINFAMDYLSVERERAENYNFFPLSLGK